MAVNRLSLAAVSSPFRFHNLQPGLISYRACRGANHFQTYVRAKEKQRQLWQEVKELLAQAAAADEEEDRRHGKQTPRLIGQRTHWRALNGAGLHRNPIGWGPASPRSGWGHVVIAWVLDSHANSGEAAG